MPPKPGTCPSQPPTHPPPPPQLCLLGGNKSQEGGTSHVSGLLAFSRAKLPGALVCRAEHAISDSSPLEPPALGQTIMPHYGLLQAPTNQLLPPGGSRAPAAPGNRTPGCSHPSGSQSRTQTRAQVSPPGPPAHPASPAGGPRAKEPISGSRAARFALLRCHRGSPARRPLTCVPVELGLDMSPSKGSSGHLPTSMSSSDFSFPRGRGEGKEDGAVRRESPPGPTALRAPTQRAGTPRTWTDFLHSLHCW